MATIGNAIQGVETVFISEVEKVEIHAINGNQSMMCTMVFPYVSWDGLQLKLAPNEDKCYKRWMGG